MRPCSDVLSHVRPQPHTASELGNRCPGLWGPYTASAFRRVAASTYKVLYSGKLQVYLPVFARLIISYSQDITGRWTFWGHRISTFSLQIICVRGTLSRALIYIHDGDTTEISSLELVRRHIRRGQILFPEWAGCSWETAVAGVLVGRSGGATQRNYSED